MLKEIIEALIFVLYMNEHIFAHQTLLATK